MRRWQLQCLLAGLLLAESASAVTVSRNATDYDGVLKRNPFNLRPPQAEPPPPPPPAPPPSNLELTGLSTAFGKQMAYMNVKDPKGSVSKALAVGHPADDGIEVLSINISTGEVRVRNRGVESLLSLEKNGAKVPVGPVPTAPVPIPTGIRPPGVPAPQPGAGGMPAGIGADGMPAGIGAPAAPGGTPAVIPTRSIRVPAVPQGQPTTQLTPEVETQMAIMEVNRMLQQQSGQGGPPLPPTPLTPAQ